LATIFFRTEKLHPRPQDDRYFHKVITCRKICGGAWLPPCEIKIHTEQQNFATLPSDSNINRGSII